MATLYVCTNQLTGEKKPIQWRGRIGSAVDGDFEFYDCCARAVDPDTVIDDGEYYAILRLNGDPVTTMIIISVVTSALTYALLPKPEKPNAQGVQSTSSNNQASGQTNTARLTQGIPDIRGTVRSYPDLAQQAWYSYIGGRRYVREKFIIGRGKYTISDVKDNETLIDDISGANYDDREGIVIFGGNLYPHRIDSLEDNRLLAPNNLEQTANFIALRYDDFNDNVPDGNYVLLSSEAPGDNDVDFSGLLDLYSKTEFTVSGFGAPFDGTYTIDKDRSIEVRKATIYYDPGGTPLNYYYPVKNTHWIPVVNASPFTDQQLYDRFDDPMPVGTIAVGDGTGVWTDWTLIKKEQQSGGTFDIYVNMLFDQGIINDDGSGRQVTFEIQARDSVTLNAATITLLEQGATPETTQEITVLGQSSSPFGITLTPFYINSPDGNACQIRIRRSDDADNTSVSDAKIETIYQMISYDTDDIGQEYWVMDVDVKSDFTNKAQSSRKINCLASAWLHEPNSIKAGNFARGPGDTKANWYNSICTDAVYVYGENQAVIQRRFDLDAMSDIRVDMLTRYSGVGYDLMNFSYTFDDIDLSLSQRIYTACNVARITAYRDGQQWTFNRKEAKQASGLFNRRNMVSDLKQTFKFKKGYDNDSIDLKWINPETDKESHIYLKVNEYAQLYGTFRATGMVQSGSSVTVSPAFYLGAYWFNSTGAVDIYYVGDNGALVDSGVDATITAFDNSTCTIQFADSTAAAAFVAAYNGFDRICLYKSGGGTLSVEGKGLRPLEIDLAGCRNERQARNRAEMELRALIYERRTATVETLQDGVSVNIGDVVKVASVFDSSVVDAEILSIDSGSYTLSEKFIPEAGKTYYAHYTKNDGSVVGPVQITGTSDPYVVTSDAIYLAYVADYDTIQAGSRIIIGTIDDLNYYSWFVTGKSSNGRTVNLELSAYDQRVFELD